MPVLQSRIEFLYGDASADSGKGKATGDALARAAADMMSKTGRKSIPLGEVVGVI